MGERHVPELTSLSSPSPAPVPAPQRVPEYGCQGVILPEGQGCSQSTGAAPPSFIFVQSPALTHHLISYLAGAGAPASEPGEAAEASIKARRSRPQCPAWLPPVTYRTMLGGLGKLAAEGLAHRTEKATEGAGKDLRLRSTWALLLKLGVGTDSMGPVGS